MEAALKAIAAPRRRQILYLVRDGELSAGQIAGHFDVTRPAISQPHERQLPRMSRPESDWHST